MAFKVEADFVVRHDFTKENNTELIKKIFQSIFYMPLKRRFPVVMFVGAASGHGKSYTTSRLLELLCEYNHIDYKEYFHDINVFHPGEYMPKFKALLEDKRLKHIPFICVHEARTVIPAKLWFSFINQNISDINAMTRAVKPMFSIFISQTLSDLTKDVRKTLNYYAKIYRPKYADRTQLQLWALYHDERDVENVKLRRRKIKGYVVDQRGKYRFYSPSRIDLGVPSREIRNMLNTADVEGKRKILMAKMEKTHLEVIKEIGEVTASKVSRLVEYYTENIHNLIPHAKVDRSNNYMFNKDFIKMHDLTKDEEKDFRKTMSDKIKVVQGGMENV